MKLSHELRETVIAAVLQQLDAAHPRALSARDLMVPLRLSGLGGSVDQEALDGLLIDLQEKALVTPATSALAGEVTRWKRTETARAWLAANGF